MNHKKKTEMRAWEGEVEGRKSVTHTRERESISAELVQQQ